MTTFAREQLDELEASVDNLLDAAVKFSKAGAAFSEADDAVPVEDSFYGLSCGLALFVNGMQKSAFLMKMRAASLREEHAETDGE